MTPAALLSLSLSLLLLAPNAAVDAEEDRQSLSEALAALSRHSFSFKDSGSAPPSTAALVPPVELSASGSGPTASPAPTSEAALMLAALGGSGSGSRTADGCPRYNQISADCSTACPNNALCAKFRTHGECTNTDLSMCVHPEGEKCAYECLDGGSAAFDEWFISPHGVPAWNESLHTNSQIEAIRMIRVPRNITKLSMQFLLEDDQVIKGKVATVMFPDGRLVPADSTLSGVSFVNLDIASIPPTVFSSNLQFLVLSNCLLKQVPPAVLGMNRLAFLNMDTNYLKTLPLELAKLPLAALYAGDNGMTEFPGFLGNMASLRIVGLGNNNLTKVTNTYRTSALNELTLDYNQLTDFAGVFPSLKVLFLRGNKLTSFPSSLPSLTMLSTLDLTENALSDQSIEEAATNLTHPLLDELMLGSNGLHAVPDFGNVFPLLRTLWVRNNSIESVTGGYSGKLEVLYAFSNKIKTFTATFSRLTTLDLTDNKLEKLDNISTISSSLQQLNVSYNMIETIQDTEVLQSVEVLNASFNSISTFDMVLPSLRVLDLSGNKLTAIPDCIWTFNVLGSLYLESNPNMEGLMFTRDQVSFLKRLSNFTIDPIAAKKDCPEAWTTEIHGYKLCVDGGDGEASSTSGSGGSSTSWQWITIAVGLVVTVGLAAFIFVMRHRRRERSRSQFYEAGEFDPKYTGRLKASDHTAGLTTSGLGITSMMRSDPSGIWEDEELREKRVDFDSIKLEDKIAAGAYGEIWIGTYRSEEVAIKKLSDHGRRDKNALAYFVAEIKLLAQLEHPRVIRFYGVAWTCLTDLCAVIEYMPGGDLHSLLQTSLLPSSRWTFYKLQIALDTVEALTYVHTLDDVLIHRDLKSRNVLLDDEWRAKVTDFGVSRFQGEADVTMTCGIGTGRWMAPEVILGRSDYNEKVDIFSFGVILSELDTHQLPYSDTTSTQLPMSEMGILQQVASGELKPSFSPTCPPEIHEVAMRCLEFKPEDRPSSLEVAYLLRKLIPMFPREDAPLSRPSSIFEYARISSGRGMSVNRNKQATQTQWQEGSQVQLSSSGGSQFSL